MPIAAARSAAFAVLLRVERESAYAVELLHSPLLDNLSALDRNLAMEIAMGVLRWQSLLDAALAAFLAGPWAKLDVEVLIALRVGAYQLLFLDRIPRHAAVNDSVELVKKAGKRSASSLVNAVLHKLGAQKDEVRARYAEPRGAKSGKVSLAAAYAHPPWLVERWIAQFGLEKTESICRFDQQPPPTALRMSGAGNDNLDGE